MSTLREAFQLVAAEYLKELWVKRGTPANVVAEMKAIRPEWPGSTDPHYPGRITEFVETIIDDDIPMVFAFTIRPASKEWEDKLK